MNRSDMTRIGRSMTSSGTSTRSAKCTRGVRASSISAVIRWPVSSRFGRQFVGIAAASPSVWFPGWLDYSRKNQIHTPRVYLSLGDKEEQAKNPLLASVGEAIQEQKKILTQDGVTCQLDWNPGNQFVDSEKRMAKGFAWLLTH